METDERIGIWDVAHYGPGIFKAEAGGKDAGKPANTIYRAWNNHGGVMRLGVGRDGAVRYLYQFPKGTTPEEALEQEDDLIELMRMLGANIPPKLTVCPDHTQYRA